MIKMIVVDMDGTFLDAHSQYNVERFEKIYQKLREREIQFVVASGNTYKQLQAFFEPHKDEMIFIAENGGYIVDKKEDLFVSHISKDDTSTIIDTLKEMPDILSWVCTKNQSYTLNSLSEEYFQMFLPYFPGVKRIRDYHLIKDDIIKFALYLPLKNVKERIYDLSQITSRSVRVVDSGHYCVDIIPNHINKGTALQRLMDKYCIKEDEIMAFGDAENDLEMLRMVKYGYIMENADDDLKKEFKRIAPHHNEQGVLTILDKFLEKNGE